MKCKIFVVAIALSLLFSGMLIAVGGEATEGKLEYDEENEPTQLADSPWPSFGRGRNIVLDITNLLFLSRTF